MSEEKKEKLKLKKTVTIGGHEVEISGTVTETAKGPSIRAMIASDAVAKYFQAQGIEKEAREKYELAQIALVNGIREPMVQMVEENPTIVPVSVRIGTTGTSVALIPHKKERASVGADAERVDVYAI